MDYKPKRGHFYLIQIEPERFIVGRALAQKPTETGYLLMDLNVYWVPEDQLKHRMIPLETLVREATEADWHLYGP